MKALGLCFICGVAVAVAGCCTNRVSDPEVVSTTTTETTVTTTVIEKTTVSVTPAAEVPAPVIPQAPAVQGVDILQGAKKPCSTVAADAPKFVDPEKE